MVSVVIPHYRGKDILLECLDSLHKAVDKENVEIILVDNASVDGGVAEAVRRFPHIKVVKLPVNKGFAGGCNEGIKKARGEFVLILNDDTVHREDFLQKLVTRLKENEKVAAIQPKILSYYDRTAFDYSGACGGEIDIFGFPFARGRIFDTIEQDRGQYDKCDRQIFWASGTCMLLRKNVAVEAGLFNERFFAHMEEIDLQWRMQLMGYRIEVEPEAIVYHRSGATLDKESPLKKYLNHRNSLLMLIANYNLPLLVYIYPIRVFLDMIAAVFSLIRRDPGRFVAILKAHLWVVSHPLFIFSSRKKVKSIRRLKDREIMGLMLKFPIPLLYYLLGKKFYSQLRKTRNI